MTEVKRRDVWPALRLAALANSWDGLAMNNIIPGSSDSIAEFTPESPPLAVEKLMAMMAMTADELVRSENVRVSGTADCADCADCTDCTDCTGCTRCARCARCADCTDCADCYKIGNGKGLRWVALGVQLTEEQYRALMAKIVGEK